MSPEERRVKYAAGLHPLYLPKFRALCEALPLPWAPYCGLRTFIQQEALWHEGRTLTGPVVTNAKPGESAHNYGCATDWAYFAPGKNPWNDAPWDQYANAVRTLGLVWAGDWKTFKEQPHNELHISKPWGELLNTFNVKGQAGVDLLLMEFIIT